jgi:hypothetical protein
MSGNPNGRPKGLQDKRTELRGLLAPHAKDLINQAVELAKAGDSSALRLCIDRLVPPVRAKEEAVANHAPISKYSVLIRFEQSSRLTDAMSYSTQFWST